MAKKFAGFTPEQIGKIVPEMSGMQSDEQAKFLAANPAAAARVGKMMLVAKSRVEGVPLQGMAEGGLYYSLTGKKFKDTALGSALTGNSSSTAGTAKPNSPTTTPAQDLAAASAAGDMSYILPPSKTNTTKPVGNEKFQALREAQQKAADVDPLGASTASGYMISDTYQQNPNYAQQQQKASVPSGGTSKQAVEDTNTPEETTPVAAQIPTTPAAANSYSELQGALNQAQAQVTSASNALSSATQALAANPTDEALKAAVEQAKANLTSAKSMQATAAKNLTNEGTPSAVETTAGIMNDPTSAATRADVVTTTEAQRQAGMIAEGTGEAGAATTAGGVLAGTAAPVTAPETKDAATVTAITTAEQAQPVIDTLVAATGKPSDQALAQAATMSPEQLAQLGLNPAQIAQAQQVVAPAARTIQEGELISGPTVDRTAVEKAINFEAATGAPSTDATVQGQLTGLMEQFEGGQTPAWAAGAMRAAAATMAARGLGASSMAGQAIVQAAMESSLPIAMQDAQTAATFEMQNLSNRQQTAMFAAEQRAAFLGMEFDQSFQTRVKNAAAISDIANQNFSAEVQVALENAQLAQTVDLANLDARNAKVLADAAALTNLDMANLDNRQQANVQRAQAFLNMDMSNLDNTQQTSVFKTQAMLNSLTTDAAARNATEQFNATSENQTNQFYDSLTASVAQFNVEQTNTMARFNAGEVNALQQFNATQQNLRDQFNASNRLIIAQANAAWAQNITTTDNAAINQANRDEAMFANQLTGTAYDNLIQKERDLLSWAWTSAENQKDRDKDVMLQKIASDGNSDDALGSAAGSFLGEIANSAIDAIWG